MGIAYDLACDTCEMYYHVGKVWTNEDGKDRSGGFNLFDRGAVSFVQTHATGQCKLLVRQDAETYGRSGVDSDYARCAQCHLCDGRGCEECDEEGYRIEGDKKI